MKTNKFVPFQGLDFQQWWRLGIVSILLTYVLIFTANVYSSGLFNYIGLDFRTYYSSAQIAANEGFSKIYDLDLQKKYQLPLYENYLGPLPANTFETVPTPYLPVFILPFIVFIFFPPNISYAIFLVISFLIFVITMIYLLRQYNLKEEFNWTIFGALGSTSFFFNLFFGQINIFLFIALVFFLLQIKNKHYLSAGLLLSIWLIKPQMLIFIIPWLLIARNTHILIGFILGSIVSVLASTILSQGDWITPWFNLLFLYPTGLATTNPLAMMNWRGLALNLETVTSSKIAWSIAYTGIFITFYYMIKTWYNLRTSQEETKYSLAILSTYAATCAITWHSHTHMALPLIAPILILLAKREITYRAWAMFIGLQFFGFIVSFIAQIWFPANNIMASTILAINVYITWWVANKSSKDKLVISQTNQISD